MTLELFFFDEGFDEFRRIRRFQVIDFGLKLDRVRCCLSHKNFLASTRYVGFCEIKISGSVITQSRGEEE